MIRRTLALAGAAVLAIGVSGLAGPASADPGAGVTQQSAAVINEVASDLDTMIGLDEIRGDFIELRETSGDEPFQLNGFKLLGCDGTNAFTITVFDSTHVIPAGERFLIADEEYNNADGPARNAPFDTTQSPVPDLVQSVGGVRLVDTNSFPVHDVQWGPSPPTACSAYDTAGTVPNDLESLNYDAAMDTWFLHDATPLS